MNIRITIVTCDFVSLFYTDSVAVKVSHDNDVPITVSNCSSFVSPSKFSTTLSVSLMSREEAGPTDEIKSEADFSVSCSGSSLLIMPAWISGEEVTSL